MKCEQAKFADNGKPLVLPRAWFARAAAAVVMRNMTKKNGANLTIATVTVNGVQSFGIVRTTPNGL